MKWLENKFHFNTMFVCLVENRFFKKLIKIREKKITIIKIRIRVYIKIKSNQILRGKIKKKIKTKYIAIKYLRTKYDIINK